MENALIFKLHEATSLIQETQVNLQSIKYQYVNAQQVGP